MQVEPTGSGGQSIVQGQSEASGTNDLLAYNMHLPDTLPAPRGVALRASAFLSAHTWYVLVNGILILRVPGLSWRSDGMSCDQRLLGGIWTVLHSAEQDLSAVAVKRVFWGVSARQTVLFNNWSSSLPLSVFVFRRKEWCHVSDGTFRTRVFGNYRIWESYYFCHCPPACIRYCNGSSKDVEPVEHDHISNMIVVNPIAILRNPPRVTSPFGHPRAKFPRSVRSSAGPFRF